MWSVVVIALVLLFPAYQNVPLEIEGGEDEEEQMMLLQFVDDDNLLPDHEEIIDSHVTWRLPLQSVEAHVRSAFQNLRLVTTKQYGKGLAIDGLLQTCEKDEFIFHENLVHATLLAHNEPKTVFIMGGGSGSAAREALKHKDIEKVIICEMDEAVVHLCRQHMTANHEAFNDERLRIIYKDAKEQLETCEEKFDVIIGDVNIPESEFSKDLYTKSFYENVVQPRLKDNGILVTQAGLAGIISHVDVFSPIHYTLKKVFKYVIPFKAQVPSSGDFCGWIMASNAPIILDAGELDKRISERIRGELLYLDGATIVFSTVLDKTMKESLVDEFDVVTEVGSPLVRGRAYSYD